jgi:hypothetical protein
MGPAVGVAVEGICTLSGATAAVGLLAAYRTKRRLIKVRRP